MDAALTYLGARMRTEKEVAGRLKTLGYTEEETAACLERLGELGLVSDEAFAGEFVRSRRAAGDVSRAHLKYQLAGRKTDPDAAEAALSAVSDEDELLACQRLAEKLMRQKAALPPRERKQKVLAALCRRGFSTETALSACRGFTEDEEDYDL